MWCKLIRVKETTETAIIRQPPQLSPQRIQDPFCALFRAYGCPSKTTEESEVAGLQNFQWWIPNQAGEVDVRSIPAFAFSGDDPITARQARILSTRNFKASLSGFSTCSTTQWRLGNSSNDSTHRKFSPNFKRKSFWASPSTTHRRGQRLKRRPSPKNRRTWELYPRKIGGYAP